MVRRRRPTAREVASHWLILVSGCLTEVRVVWMESTSTVVSDELYEIAKFLRDKASECESGLGLRAKLLRDMSGLCKKGWLRLMEEGFHRAEAQRRVDELRSDPDIVDFVNFLHACNPEGLTDVAAFLAKEFHELDKALLQREAQMRAVAQGESEVRGPRTKLPAPLAKKRARSPATSPRRSLPEPPGCPEAVHVEWNLPWETLLRENMSMWRAQLWVCCPGCQKHFAAPSAFKQHLHHKVNTFRHPPSHIFQSWYCDSLWDDAWREIETSKKAEFVEAAPNDLEVKDAEGTKSPVNKDWTENLPVPPAPIRAPDELRKLRESGWMEPLPDFVIEMMAEEAYREGDLKDSSRNNWFSYVKSVDEALQREFENEDQSRKAFLTFGQIPDCSMVVKLNPRWNSEEVLSHLAATVGMSFETLGAKWLLSYDGSTSDHCARTLHFEVAFSPAKGEEIARGLDLLPPQVREALYAVPREEAAIGVASAPAHQS